MDVSFWIPLLSMLVAVPTGILAFLQITDRINLFRVFPPIVYRVTNVKDGRGLWTTQDPIFEGQAIQEAWSFKAKKGGIYVIEGPMLRDPLRPGKYRATFRFKVHDVDVKAANRYLLRAEVLSHIDGQRKIKLLGGRTLTTYDFEKAEEYRNFPIDFEVFSMNGGGEQKVELATLSWESSIRVTFDSVRLSRR